MEQRFSLTNTNESAFANDAERMRFAMNAAGIGVWEVDVATNEVIWDDRCRQIFGLSKNNIIPYSQAIQYIHPDDVEGVNENVQAAMRGDNNGIYDVTYRTIGADDGLLRWVNFSGSAYFDGEQNLTRFGGIAQDITEQVMAQQASEKSEARFRALIEEAPVATCLFVGRELRIEVANELVLALWGKGPSALGKPLAEALPELVGQPFLGILDEIFTSGQAYHMQAAPCDLVRNGVLSTYYFDFTYKPLFNEDGEVYAIMDMAVDVTEQVLSRKAKDEASARLRGVVSTAPAAIGVFLGEDMIVDMPNEAFIEVAGKGRDIVGKPLSVVMPELAGEGQPFLDILKNVYHNGTTFKANAAPVKIMRDGVLEDHYFNVTFSPLQNAVGKIYGILDISIDVTDLITAQAELTETRRILQDALELSELGTWALNLNDNSLRFSNRLRNWWGFDKNESITLEAFYATVPVNFHSLIQEALTTATAPGSDTPYDVEYVVINRQTGKLRNIHAQGRAFFAGNGKAYKVEGVARDITVERQLQLALEGTVQIRSEELASAVEELRATNEDLAESNTSLLRSNEELSQFAYVASHDLQEPLRKIQMFSDMLKNSYEFPAGLRPTLEKISTSSLRMSTLIRDLLDFSRVQQSAVRFEQVGLQKILRLVLDDLDAIIKEKKAIIHIGTLPVIEAIPFQMQQLFYNLVGNALKFGREDGQPVISIRCMEVAESITGQELGKDRAFHITIEDNGIGFKPEHAKKIFEMFQRLHGRQEYAGTGIGLAICKRIVENHQGRIYAEPAAGGGAAFHILLPKR